MGSPTDDAAALAGAEGPAARPAPWAGLADACPHGVLVVDGGGTLRYANQAAATLLGCPLPLLSGRQAAQVLPTLPGPGEAIDIRRPGGAGWFQVQVWPAGPSDVAVLLRDASAEVAARAGLAMHREAEQALRESEQRFRQVFEQSPLAKATVGTDLRLREVNPAFCRLLGAEPDALAGRALLELVHPDGQAAVARLLQDEVEQAHLEVRLLRLPGDPVWVNIHLGPIRDGEGRVVQTLAIIEDIDERRRLTEALRESQQRYRLFADAALEGVVVHDFGTVLDVSRRFATILGFAPPELIGRPVAQISQLVAAEQGAAPGVPHGPVEIDCLRRDGVPITVEYRANELSHRGRTVRIGILRDVTETRRAEATLRRLNETLEQQVEERARQLSASRARLQAFFDSSEDWLTLQRAAADGRFVYQDINPACERAYGLPRSQVIGRTIEQVLGEQAAQLPLQRARECVRTGRMQRYVTRRTMAGQTRTIDVLFVRVPGVGDGDDPHLITSARDITERMELEAQLAQAQKMEAVGQLTGGVAHDFNNLLTVILGNLETVEDRIAPAPSAADVKRMLRAAGIAIQAVHRAAALTQRLLAFSRRQVLDPRPVDGNALVGGMLELLGRTLGEAVTIETRLEPGLWSARVDPNQLESALLNLVVNARDAMAGGGRLLVRTGNVALASPHGGPDGELPAGDYVCIEVTDSGIGMPPEVLARAFEPFFTTKEPGVGTGLGLSQVYGFVRQSGGQVRIESTPGAGTSVHILLPRLADGETSPESVRAAPVAAPAADGAGLVVLLVEDNDAVRAHSAAVLAEMGCTVIEAADAAAALEALARTPGVALLFSDIGLPGGMNGSRLADAARALRPGLPVLLTSGYPQPPEGPVRGPAVPLLRKPFARADLQTAVRRVLDLQTGHTRLDGATAP